MKRYVVELTIHEYYTVDILADNAEVAQAKVKDGFGRWMFHPSRILSTKILREFSTEDEPHRNGHK
jgi:hypothetical protein